MIITILEKVYKIHQQAKMYAFDAKNQATGQENVRIKSMCPWQTKIKWSLKAQCKIKIITAAKEKTSELGKTIVKNQISHATSVATVATMQEIVQALMGLVFEEGVYNCSLLDDKLYKCIILICYYKK